LGKIFGHSGENGPRNTWRLFPTRWRAMLYLSVYESPPSSRENDFRKIFFYLLICHELARRVEKSSLNLATSSDKLAFVLSARGILRASMIGSAGVLAA
jgi:hypothetical protein